MTTERIIGAAGPAAALAALTGIPADAYHFTISSRADEAGTILFKLHGLLLVAAFCLAIVALAGIALRIGDRLGGAGRAGVLLAFAGTVLVVGNITTEAFWMPMAGEAISDPTGYTLAAIIASFAVFSLGWLLTGIAAARTGLVATPAAALLCLGAIVAFTPLPGAYILLLAGLAATGRSLAQESTGRAPALATA